MLVRTVIHLFVSGLASAGDSTSEPPWVVEMLILVFIFHFGKVVLLEESSEARMNLSLKWQSFRSFSGAKI